MKEFFHMFMFGAGMLILLYLALKNADGVAKIFNATGTQSNSIIKSLQGR